MATSIVYRLARVGEEARVSALIGEVFDAVVGPQFVPAGRAEFHDYIRPERFVERAQADHFVLVAEAAGELVGMIEMRGCNYVSLLFVAVSHQGRGIARELLAQALDICRERGSLAREIGVKSSPNAVPAYAKLGFRATDEEQTVHGIRFTPMVLRLEA